MTSTAQPDLPRDAREKLLRIGEVVRRLTEEFPDISISKIRYLEDEGLLTPRRTQGGYRLFSEDDLERLQTILRLQRDEFLPLRVIRDELDAPGQKERKRRRPTALGAAGGGGRPRRAVRARRHHARAREGARGLRAARRRAGAAATSATPSPTPTSPPTCAQLARYGVDAAAPAHVPHRGRPRGGAARAARRAGAARAERRAPRHRACRTCSRSPSSRRSCPRCSSGATCETWRSERPA